MVGEIVHIELPSRDFARSATFYAKLFGWKTEGVQSGGHLLFQLPGAPQGSLIRDALAQAPGPVPFIAVENVDQCLEAAKKEGGRILVQRMNLPNRGVCGLFADCDGNIVGVLATRQDVAGKTADKVADKVVDKGRLKKDEDDLPASKADKPRSKDAKVIEKTMEKTKDPAPVNLRGRKPPARKR